MEGMISNKIKEIVEQRRKSIDKDRNFKFTLGEKVHKDNRPTLSESIEKESGISIISEIKPASPTLGKIRKELDIKKIAKEMESSGVVGLSVLTEPNYFDGSYENLRLAIENTKIPCLMKDFVVDPVQNIIASQLGATNILIINSICDLEENYHSAVDHGLEPLIEIHEVEELQDIKHLFDIGLKPKLIGVNNRNLKTLEINLNTSKEIIPKLKAEFGNEIVIVSESGVNTIDDINFLLEYQADAFLIGSSIMQSENIKEKIFSLRGVN
ncbi:MAG: indole-3-glycerol-phosphate synthase [Candidatus Hodarchaeota archaeon]